MVMGSQQDAGAVARIRLPAVIDEQGADVLRRELRGLIEGTAAERIEVDARELRRITPRGVGVLAAAGLAIRRRGATVEVVNCDPSLLGVMRVARLPAATGDRSAATLVAPDIDVDWTPWWSSAAANA
ncbi:MAG: hypothetical protein NVS3B26_26290 [Mycobacteriales bacterium]